MIGDVNYEMPIDFVLAPANQSEQVYCRELASRWFESPWSGRTESFVADRGLDSDRLRKRLYDKGIVPVIQSRKLWQDDNLHPDQLNVPTRPFQDIAGVDTLLRTEEGVLYCQCPATRTIRQLNYQGRETRRNTLKRAGPAAVYDLHCEGREQCYRMGQVKAGARTRIVRQKINPDHLRSYGPLPPSTCKWRKCYSQRSALQRINSRIDNGYLMHDHFLRGRQQLELKVCVRLTVMLAVACRAIKADQPRRMRALVNAVAA